MFILCTVINDNDPEWTLDFDEEAQFQKQNRIAYGQLCTNVMLEKRWTIEDLASIWTKDIKYLQTCLEEYKNNPSSELDSHGTEGVLK
jgi:hypothetical protein